MIVDGPKLAREVEQKITKEVQKIVRSSGEGSAPNLMVFSAGKNPANEAYIQRKQAFAERVGIRLTHVVLPTSSTKLARLAITKALASQKPDGAIVQLPVAKKLDTKELLSAIPHEKDVDALAEGGRFFLSPVVLSLRAVLSKYKIETQSANVVIIGAGPLVGRPVSKYFIAEGRATVMVCNKFTKDLIGFTRKADILISGAGAAHIISAKMVKKGVVALDVGFSEKNGKIVGDLESGIAKKARVFAGVPGGIGSMTVAYLFWNVLEAKKRQK